MLEDVFEAEGGRRAELRGSRTGKGAGRARGPPSGRSRQRESDGRPGRWRGQGCQVHSEESLQCWAERLLLNLTGSADPSERLSRGEHDPELPFSQPNLLL